MLILSGETETIIHILMHDLQVLQNKAAKGILDRPNHVSSTVALKALRGPTLSQERLVD